MILLISIVYAFDKYTWILDKLHTYTRMLSRYFCLSGEVKRSICTLKDSLEGEYSTFAGLCNQELTISVLKDHYSPPDIITGTQTNTCMDMDSHITSFGATSMACIILFCL